MVAVSNIHIIESHLNIARYGTIVPFLILEALGWGGRCGDTRDSYIMQIGMYIAYTVCYIC